MTKPFKTGFWFGLGFVAAYFLLKVVGTILMMLVLGGPMFAPMAKGIDYLSCIL